jgi:hypothetical protein
MTPLRRTTFVASVLVLFPAFLAKGEENANSTEPRLSETRRQMLLEYTFSPQGAKPSEAPTSLRSEASVQPRAAAPSGSEVVTMSPFEVRGNAEPGAIGPLAVSRTDDAPATVADRLGIGVHNLKLGKVHVFVRTVFYLPFLVGLEW